MELSLILNHEESQECQHGQFKTPRCGNRPRSCRSMSGLVSPRIAGTRATTRDNLSHKIYSEARSDSRSRVSHSGRLKAIGGERSRAGANLSQEPTSRLWPSDTTPVTTVNTAARGFPMTIQDHKSLDLPVTSSAISSLSNNLWFKHRSAPLRPSLSTNHLHLRRAVPANMPSDSQDASSIATDEHVNGKSWSLLITSTVRCNILNTRRLHNFRVCMLTISK